MPFFSPFELLEGNGGAKVLVEVGRDVYSQSHHFTHQPK